MASEEQVRILKQGAQIWNRWRKENQNVRLDLMEADLSGAFLHKVDLGGVVLVEANLSYADLTEANFSSADLSFADLSQAKLSEASLRGAVLRGARLIRTDLDKADLCDTDFSNAFLINVYLSRADLRGAKLYRALLYDAFFSGTRLHNADFTEADLGWTVFGNVDLSEVHGLKTLTHRGPSHIDIHTVYQSKGNIPEIFLRGAGVQDNFITYMKSLTSAAFDFYSCFISYSTKDQAFTERLHADLQAKGVRCWYAPHDIQGGKKIHEQIDQAIRVYDKLLVILSENSMGSEWVKTEIYNARQQEIKEKRRKLFPISLVGYDSVRQWQAFDADTGKDMGREVREYYIPDFTHWKDHDAYQQAFERLLRDLKAQT